MEKEQALVPCPSCGKAPSVDIMEYSECARPFGDRFIVKVICKQCHLSSSSDFEERAEDAKQDAIKYWNAGKHQ